MGLQQHLLSLALIVVATTWASHELNLVEASSGDINHFTSLESTKELKQVSKEEKPIEKPIGMGRIILQNQRLKSKGHDFA